MKLTRTERPVIFAMNNGVPLTKVHGVGWLLGKETISWRLGKSLVQKRLIESDDDHPDNPRVTYRLTEYAQEVILENLG